MTSTEKVGLGMMLIGLTAFHYGISGEVVGWVMLIIGWTVFFFSGIKRA